MNISLPANGFVESVFGTPPDNKANVEPVKIDTNFLHEKLGDDSVSHQHNGTPGQGAYAYAPISIERVMTNPARPLLSYLITNISDEALSTYDANYSSWVTVYSKMFSQLEKCKNNHVYLDLIYGIKHEPHNARNTFLKWEYSMDDGSWKEIVANQMYSSLEIKSETWRCRGRLLFDGKTPLHLRVQTYTDYPRSQEWIYVSHASIVTIWK